MGKKYGRYIVSLNTGGVFEDPDWAFEVVDSSIVIYKVREEGILWWKKNVYERSSVYKLTPDTKVKVWGITGTSGNCQVVGPSYKYDYHILGEVDAFAREVEYEIRNIR